LPDVLTREQTHRLLGSVYKLRYRVFFVTLYSTGLRLGEGLTLQVGDIDGQRMRIHVRGGKGNKDRYVPITEPLLGMLRRWWKTHENPRLLFPNPSGGVARMRKAATAMHAGGVQAAMRAAVADCGIRLRITVIRCATSSRPICWSWAWICASSSASSLMSVQLPRHAMPISPM
jgi:integrase/recombinase XerD